MDGNGILSISKPSVSECAHPVDGPNNQHLFRKFVKLPMNNAERRRENVTRALNLLQVKFESMIVHVFIYEFLDNMVIIRK